MRRALALVLALGCGKSPSAPADGAIDPDATPPPPDAFVAPALRNPVAFPDDLLATTALQILGANIPGASATGCGDCHSLTRQRLRNWRALSDTALAVCLTDLPVSSQRSAREMIDCFRADPRLPASDFQARKLGIYSAATHLAWFDATTRYAYGPGPGQMAAAELVTSGGMPRSGGIAIPFTQSQFDVVAEWFARGLPRLEQTLPQDPAPTTCQPSVSSEVATHVAAMRTQGWRALNASNMMAMHGCGAATDPRQCLQDVPLGSDKAYGAGWDLPGRGRLRVLADVTYNSAYWSRSSPDGRFIAHGAQTAASSYIIDLQRDGLLIEVDAAYDPNFFPDNSGFVFQGSPNGRNTCGIGVLTSNPTRIRMAEPECTNLSSVGLYEHVGAIAGGDHFAIDGPFVSDDGGHFPTFGDPAAHFSSSARTGFIPLMFDGTKFAAKQSLNVEAPFEGDSVLSPSARLVISRVAGPDEQQLGFVLREVVATPMGASYTIQTPEVARYCVNGGKPGFSYDERWMVYHHYLSGTDADAIELGFTGAGDPGFAPYLTQGAANLYLIELATGVSVRITNMQAGQYAVFPHFRSDGWIYAVVRDGSTDHEYMVASDAALIAEQLPAP